MNPQQDMYPDITPEEAKTSLGLATRLSEQHLMSQMPQEGTTEAPQEPQEAPQQEEMVEPKETPEEEKKEPEEDKMAKLELSIVDRLDKIRKELKDDQKSQVDSLRKEIENALNQTE